MTLAARDLVMQSKGLLLESERHDAKEQNNDTGEQKAG
jgi:hypothetical protein